MSASESSNFSVYVRWRPAIHTPNSTSVPSEIDYSTEESHPKQCISISASPSLLAPKSTRDAKGKAWKSGPSFTRVFQPTFINKDVYTSVVAPTLDLVLQGATCNLFAYGHSGSGKTHTIVGYDYEHEDQFGMCLAAAHDLFQSLQHINEKLSSSTPSESSTEVNHGQPGQDKGPHHLALALRIFDLRAKTAHDLLSPSPTPTPCHIRTDADGTTHIRGETEVLASGAVRVRPVIAVPCWSFPELHDTLLSGLAKRSVGASTVHDESSRTHAVIEVEIVNAELIAAREALIEAESELVPVGKRATDVYIEESMKSLIKKDDGTYAPNPECPVDQAKIDAAEAEKAVFEARVRAAEDAVAACFASSPSPCLGGKLVFVDLAGSEYFDQGNVKNGAAGGPKQTPQERQQGRQINSDLFALKEVIRARALGHARIPYRSSPLTMVLKSHFECEEGRGEGKKKGQSAMILTVSPEEAQFAATMNTLKYGNLVGVAGTR